VPANADAVIFADRTEMLACLALDWAKGMLAHRWWWRSLARDDDLNRTVWSAWLDTPHFAPPALAHLAARGQAVMVARRMDEAIAAALLHRVLAAFNLRDLAMVIQESVADGTPEVSAASAPMAAVEGRSETNPEERESVAPLALSTPRPAPWAARVP